ncbi:MAG: hypothetical protein EBS50_09565, partial [Sphingomonadaceae bacterium]|nr:hypothetical protein [Sphingomonadaceae bacterium]
MTGGTQADTIDGGSGADSLTGAAGADSLTGGEGADTINGGNGNDTIILTETTAAADQVWLTGTAHASAGNAVDTISGFASTAGQDVLRFGSTFLGLAYTSNSINSTMASTSGSMAAQTDKIVIVSDNVAGWSGSGAVATFVGGSAGFSSTGSQQAVIIAD